MADRSGFENAYALIVGISKYKDPDIPELKFTRADAEGIFDLLTNPEIAGLRKANVKILLDEEATRFNIRNAISSWLYKNADEKSVVFVYFAGHGGVEEDRLGIEKDRLSKYLIPHDTVLEDLFSSAISNRDFNELLLSIRSKRLVIFMDTCYSGGITERKARDLKISDDPYQKLGEGEGRIVIAASQPDQRSYEDSRLGHGVFTFNLLEALRGKADWNRDGYITVFDAYKYLQDAVPDMAMKLAGGKQDPIFRGDIKRDFIISVDQKRLNDIQKETIIEEKICILRKYYDDGRIPGKLYDWLLLFLKKNEGELSEYEIKIAKRINDLYTENISLTTFIEDMKSIKPGCFGKIEPDKKEKKTEEKKKEKITEIPRIFEIGKEFMTIYFIKITEQVKSIIEIFNFSSSSIKILAIIILVLTVLIFIYFLIPNPELSISHDPLYFKIDDISAGESVSRFFSISNTGTRELYWTVSSDSEWLILSPLNGTNSGNINISVNSSGLSPGSHSGIIKIYSNGGNKSGEVLLNISESAIVFPSINNSIGMTLIRIPSGVFDMGSPSNEPDRSYWEGPLHSVEIKNDFYIGQFEITQRQWVDIMGFNPSEIKGDDLPVAKVTWQEVQRFILNLNEKEKTNKYRLPSESEWEYAVRAGRSTNYSFGANKSRLGDYAWFMDNSEFIPHPVGKKKPNRWFLYDMYGNVYEWVQDEWHDNFDDAPTDGSAWIKGTITKKVVRGCSWNSNPMQCRSAFRFNAEQKDRENDLGFRIVKDI